MNVAKKLALAISPLVVLSAFLVGFNYFSMKAVQLRIPEISEFAVTSTELIQAAKTAFARQVSYYEDAVFMDDAEAIETARTAHTDVMTVLQDLKGLSGLSERARAEIDRFNQRMADYTLSAGDIYSRMIDDEIFLETSINAQAVKSLGEEKTHLVQELNSFSEIVRNELAQKIATVSASAKRKNDLNALISTVVIGLSVLILYLLIDRRVTRPMVATNRKLQKAMAEIWGEMELARKIQTVLLPERPAMEGYDVIASLDPADEVGGDYYDVISAGGYQWIVIGDVSGHGVSAGLVMMMVQTAIHTVLLENPGVPPSELLTTINRTLYQNINKMHEAKHMTIVVLAGGTNGDFVFSGLHEDILVWRAETGRVESIETDGMWIGMEPDIAPLLSNDRLTLDSGDCMVLFTDGITEARGADGTLFGDDRLVALLEASGSRSVAEIHAKVMDALTAYEKPDDVTLVIVKRN